MLQIDLKTSENTEYGDSAHKNSDDRYLNDGNIDFLCVIFKMLASHHKINKIQRASLFCIF